MTDTESDAMLCHVDPDTARSLMLYVVPLTRPGMVTGDVVSTGLNATQLEPLSVEYS